MGGHYSSICRLGEEMIKSKTKSAASIKMANNSLVNASLMNFPALPNKKTSVFSFSSPVERKKKSAKTSPPAKTNQQPKLIPEISNRFSVLSDLVLKPKTQNETSSLSSNSVCSSSFSSVKTQANKNKLQQNKTKTKIRFKSVGIRYFDEDDHGISEKEQLTNIKTCKTVNKGKEEEEKKEVFLHRIGKDRAEENNAIKILACFNNKNEKEEVDYCEIDQGQAEVGQGQGGGEVLALFFFLSTGDEKEN